MNGEKEEPNSKPCDLAGSVASGRRTGWLNHPRKNVRRGRRWAAHQCSRILLGSLKDEDFGGITRGLWRWIFGRISLRPDFRGRKRPPWKVPSSFPSFLPVQIHSAVVFVELAFWREETANKRVDKKMRTQTFSLAVEKINRAEWQWFSVECGPSSLNGVDRGRLRGVRSGDLNSRSGEPAIRRQLLIRGNSSPKIQTGLWGCTSALREERMQGPRHLEACGLTEGEAGHAGQSDPGKTSPVSPEERTSPPALPGPSRCSFLPTADRPLPEVPLRVFIPVQALLLASRGTSVIAANHWWQGEKEGKCSFQFWWFAKPIFLFGNRLSLGYKPLK